MLILSQVSMMGVFIGYDSLVLTNLLAAQNYLLLPLAALCVFGLLVYIHSFGLKQGLWSIWQRLPGWIIFMLVMINLLVLSGGIAVFLVQQKFGMPAAAGELTAIFSALMTSFAFMLTYTFLQQDKLPSTYAERNQHRGDVPLEWHELWKK